MHSWNTFKYTGFDPISVKNGDLPWISKAVEFECSMASRAKCLSRLKVENRQRNIDFMFGSVRHEEFILFDQSFVDGL